MFKKIHEAFKSMNLKQDRQLHFHGSFGSGKSHMMAALVCLLKREGRTVVYLPDCYELFLSEPSLYVIKALSLTFNNDPHLRSEVRRLAHVSVGKDSNPSRLDWEVTAFCNMVSNLGKTIILVVDQVNLLDHDLNPEDRISNQKKMQARKLLDGMASNHLMISCFTGNYRDARHDELRDTLESRLTLYHGLDNVSRCANC